jgi:hypothetical protein
MHMHMYLYIKWCALFLPSQKLEKMTSMYVNCQELRYALCHKTFGWVSDDQEFMYLKNPNDPPQIRPSWSPNNVSKNLIHIFVVKNAPKIGDSYRKIPNVKNAQCKNSSNLITLFEHIWFRFTLWSVLSGSGKEIVDNTKQKKNIRQKNLGWKKCSWKTETWRPVIEHHAERYPIHCLIDGVQ